MGNLNVVEELDGSRLAANIIISLSAYDFAEVLWKRNLREKS